MLAEIISRFHQTRQELAEALDADASLEEIREIDGRLQHLERQIADYRPAGDSELRIKFEFILAQLAESDSINRHHLDVLRDLFDHCSEIKNSFEKELRLLRN